MIDEDFDDHSDINNFEESSISSFDIFGNQEEITNTLDSNGVNFIGSQGVIYSQSIIENKKNNSYDIEIGNR